MLYATAGDIADVDSHQIARSYVSHLGGSNGWFKNVDPVTSMRKELDKTSPGCMVILSRYTAGAIRNKLNE